ncbi:ATP-binding cassette domain-containing protein [bacterium]|nr:ATP-binding cassette domain-containing protein [bacterium]
MIKLDNLTKIYNSNGSSAIGLQNINLELHCGEFVAVVGASGSGKTTLLNVISGMDTYNEGELIIDGKSTSGFTIADFENFRQNNVAFIFQNYQLIDSYTVLENVMVELLIRGFKKKDAKLKAKEYLEQVGLIKRIHHRATKLSGGEKQRVVIARALASDAKILACDEPTGNLDSKNAAEIIQLIHSVAKDKLVLLVTHDESLIKDVATRIVRIRDGKIESDIQQNLEKNSEENLKVVKSSISKTINSSEIVAVIGTSGSSKTALLNVISEIITYNEGDSILNSELTSKLTSEDMIDFLQNNVTFILEKYQLIDSYTVLDNVMVELLTRGYKEETAILKAKESLSRVGLSKQMHYKAYKLDNNEKQRLNIARALTTDAKILACNEPTGNNALEMTRLIHSAAKDKVVIFFTSAESMITSAATKIVQLQDGKIEDVILQHPTEDVLKEELNFQKHKISYLTKFYVTIKNTFRTPKTTFFMLILFLFLAFVIFFSVAYIPLNVVATDNTEIEYTMFENRDKNRVITYMDNSFVGTLPADENSIYYNDYLLDVTFKSKTTSTTLSRHLKESSYLKLSTEGIHLVVGNFPQTDKEVVVILGKNFSEDYLNRELGSMIQFSLGNLPFSPYYKISGFAYEDDAKSGFTNIYLNNAGAKIFLDGLNEKYISINYYSAFANDFSLKEDKDTKSVYINQKLNSDAIRVSFVYKNRNYGIYLGNYKLDLSKYKIEYFYDNVNNRAVEISAKLANQIVSSTPYRASIYTTIETENVVISSLKRNSSLEVFPMSESIRYIPHYDIMGIATNLFYVVFLFIEIVVSILISSLISAFILNSKKKELSILRVLGLTKTDVFLTIIFELFIIMLIAIGLNLAISGILLLFIKKHAYSIIFDSTGKLILSIVILMAMSVVIAYRWTRKMFKNTAREVLKAGDIE